MEVYGAWKREEAAAVVGARDMAAERSQGMVSCWSSCLQESDLPV
jgi:hypothetical protein